MAAQTLAEALEAEHRRIDAGIEAFLAEPAADRSAAAGQPGPRSGAADQPGAEPLFEALHALRRHIFLEEEFLFGPLREGGLVAPIFVMMREHGEIWDTMDTLLAQVAIEPAAEAVEPTCRALLEQLDRHNFKEEPIIYPEVDAAMHGPAGDRLREWLQDGEVPEGWRCARASAAPVGRPAPQP
ncbi:MAG: hemerythrin domain-containing protein [Solirubrobacteraceae bacterium]